MDDSFEWISVQTIIESANNPRRHFDEDSMRDLVESIQRHGILQPLLVRECPTDSPCRSYELIAGARRLRAARLLGLDIVPVILTGADAVGAAEIQLVENLQRVDLGPIEEALGFWRLRDDLGLDVHAISAGVGRSERYVRDRLLLLELPDSVQELVATGKLTLSCALLLARSVRDPERAAAAAEKIAFGRYWPGEQAAEGMLLPSPMSLRQAQEFLAGEVLLDLERACFPTDDVMLLPAAGACLSCPKALRADRDLFGEIAGDTPWSCTDATCYQAKIDAVVERRRGELAAKGVECQVVVEDDGGLEGTIPLQSVCRQDAQLRPWQTLLGKAAQKLPVTIVRTPDGWEERVSRVEALRLAQPKREKQAQRKESSPSPYVDSPEDKRERRNRHEARMLVVGRFQAALIDRCRDGHRQIDPLETMRLLVRACNERWFTEETEAIERALDLDLHAELHQGQVDAAAVQQKLCALAVALMALESPSSEYSTVYSEEFVAGARLIGFDIEAAERESEGESAPPKPRAKKGKRAAGGDDDELEPAKEAETTSRGKRAKGGRNAR